MSQSFRSFTQKALTAMLASIGFTAYIGCTDEPDMYGAPLPEDSTRVGSDIRPMYVTRTSTYIKALDE